ncbi:MAG TPA: hypothetical protein VGD65_01985 [Chryseosolibacter sp.]
MFRFFALILFVFLGSTVYSQAVQAHEPTSATDGGVKLHNTKKSRFTRTIKARKSERVTSPGKDSKYKAEVRSTERYVKDSKSKARADARGTERHGKSFRKSRGSRKLNGESRVFRRHGATATSSAERRSKVKRALGKSSQ